MIDRGKEALLFIQFLAFYNKRKKRKKKRKCNECDKKCFKLYLSKSWCGQVCNNVEKIGDISFYPNRWYVFLVVGNWLLNDWTSNYVCSSGVVTLNVTLSFQHLFIGATNAYHCFRICVCLNFPNKMLILLYLPVTSYFTRFCDNDCYIYIIDKSKYFKT